MYGVPFLLQVGLNFSRVIFAMGLGGANCVENSLDAKTGSLGGAHSGHGEKTGPSQRLYTTFFRWVPGQVVFSHALVQNVKQHTTQKLRHHESG